MRVLFTRPKHDTENHYLYCWTQSLVDLAIKKSYVVFDLKKEKSNRKAVQGYLKKDQASHVFLNGHGSDAAIYGHNNEELVSNENQPSVFRGKVFFLRACSAGNVLGPQAVKKGAKAFIGYRSEFRFWNRSSFLQRPLDDPLARPFMECSNQVMVALLKGHSPRIAQEKSLDLYKKEIIRAFTSEGDTSILPALLHNMKHQVFLEASK